MINTKKMMKVKIINQLKKHLTKKILFKEAKI